MLIITSNLKLLAMIVVVFMTLGAVINVLIKCEPKTYRDELGDACAKLVFMILLFITVSSFVILTDWEETMEVYSALHFVLRVAYIAACVFAGWWIGQIAGSIIVHEKPSKEHILNLVYAELLKLVCGLFLCVHY